MRGEFRGRAYGSSYSKTQISPKTEISGICAPDVYLANISREIDPAGFLVALKKGAGAKEADALRK